MGIADRTGLYHGTQQSNQGQMDRWNIVTTLNYLPHDMEVDIVYGKAWQDHDEGRRTISNMLAADLTRKGFVNGNDLVVVSPGTVLHWAENADIFRDVGFGSACRS